VVARPLAGGGVAGPARHCCRHCQRDHEMTVVSVGIAWMWCVGIGVPMWGDLSMVLGKRVVGRTTFVINQTLIYFKAYQSLSSKIA